MDEIFESWLREQAADATALTAESDVLRVHAEQARVPSRFIAEFLCPTLVRTDTGIACTDRFAVLICFPPDYLRVAYEAARVVNLIAPDNLFHPNVRGKFVCTGRLAPGTRLRHLLYQVHEILTFARCTPNEGDALNPDACEWARRHTHLFPLDRRPLRRRVGNGSIGHVAEVTEAGAAR